MRNIGVVLAAGTGARFRTTLPKQFMKVAGKMVIEHTVDIFEKNDRIDEIAIVVDKNHRHIVEQILLTNKWGKVKRILNGGQERNDSTKAALRAVDDGSEQNIILHDAVRPLLSDRIIDDIISALDEYEAVDTCIKATDTIVISESDDEVITAIPNRNTCYQGQTPQAFRVATLIKAYSIADKDPNFTASDDCGVVLKYLPDIKVKIVNGSVKNVKLTHIEDYYLLDKLFQLNTQKLVVSGNYTEIRDKVIVVIGGSDGIGKAICELSENKGSKVYSFSRKTTGTDIRKIETIEAALSSVAQKEGGIDCVVLTAGLLHIAPLCSASPAIIDEMIDTNFRGAVYVSACAYPYLKERKGALLHFTSSSYTFGRPLYGLYSSSKAAIVNMVQSLSQEWEVDGIRVNCINPERTKTDMRIRNFGVEDESTLLDPNDVAKVALSVLLSKYSGQIFDIKASEELL